mmetsp:Transcript_71565/g.163986  ORF Transcript_71565/g.163986 Transcript_71565/m.163986 type:complete len:279 (+) Transcript_71565:264-1100(+)
MASPKSADITTFTLAFDNRPASTHPVTSHKHCSPDGIPAERKNASNSANESEPSESKSLAAMRESVVLQRPRHEASKLCCWSQAPHNASPGEMSKPVAQASGKAGASSQSVARCSNSAYLSHSWQVVIFVTSCIIRGTAIFVEFPTPAILCAHCTLSSNNGGLVVIALAVKYIAKSFVVHSPSLLRSKMEFVLKAISQLGRHLVLVARVAKRNLATTNSETVGHDTGWVPAHITSWPSCASGMFPLSQTVLPSRITDCSHGNSSSSRPTSSNSKHPSQ